MNQDLKSLKTYTPGVNIQSLLLDAARAQKSGVLAQMALVQLETIAKRAIELKDTTLLEALETLGMVQKA